MRHIINKGIKFFVDEIGYIELQDMMGDDLSIVSAARTSYLKDIRTSEEDKKLLNYLYNNEHFSPFEMVEFRFRVKAPIFVARQWMRHRTGSYNEQSRRYSQSEIEFFVPKIWRKQSLSNKQSSSGYLDEGLNTQITNLVSDLYSKIKNTYEYLISLGVSREQARTILPVGLYTTFIYKTDARNLMHFLKLRLSPDAQNEIRQYALIIFTNHFKPNLPWTAELFEKTLKNSGVSLD